MTTTLMILVSRGHGERSGDRSPGISRITAGHGLPVLLGASVYKVRQIFLARPRGRPGGVVAPGRAWRCCEVVLVSCVFRPARSATGTSASLVAESSASIHLPGIVWHLWWDGDLVLASVGGQFVGGG